MTTKRLALLAVLPLIIAVILGVLAMLPSGPGVTPADYNRIKAGMTLAEVEEIFGRKGIDRGEWGMMWRANDGSAAMVRFSDDCVMSKRWTPPDETVGEKIRRWLHLQPEPPVPPVPLVF
jgi:hypothetical protein